MTDRPAVRPLNGFMFGAAWTRRHPNLCLTVLRLLPRGDPIVDGQLRNILAIDGIVGKFEPFVVGTVWAADVLG